MPTYTTECLMNLRTGAPFTFEVVEDGLRRLARQKEMITTAGGRHPVLGDITTAVTMYEVSLFSSYEELLEIWTDNGFTIELITQILLDFGISEDFIPKLLEDDDYIANVRPWFEGITCDGERAARTLKIVYDVTKKYYSATSNVESIDFP